MYRKKRRKQFQQLILAGILTALASIGDILGNLFSGARINPGELAMVIQRIFSSISNIKGSDVACIFSVVILCLTKANFITGGRKEGLDKKGTKKEANTDEEVESIDEGSAFLRSKCED